MNFSLFRRQIGKEIIQKVSSVNDFQLSYARLINFFVDFSTELIESMVNLLFSLKCNL